MTLINEIRKYGMKKLLIFFENNHKIFEAQDTTKNLFVNPFFRNFCLYSEIRKMILRNFKTPNHHKIRKYP